VGDKTNPTPEGWYRVSEDVLSNYYRPFGAGGVWRRLASGGYHPRLDDSAAPRLGSEIVSS